MPLASYLNADAVTQEAGTVIRTAAVSGTCVLASADTTGNSSNLLGVRLDDVTAGAAGTIGAFEPGIRVLMTSEPSVGDLIYLADDGSGRGVIVAPDLEIKIGICYRPSNVGGKWYANLTIESAPGGTSGDFIPTSEKGTPNGVATLGSDGLVPENELPSVGLTAKGDLLTSDGSALARLPVGANGQILLSRPAAPLGIAWEDNPSANSGETWEGFFQAAFGNGDPNLYWEKTYGYQNGTALDGATPYGIGIGNVRLVQFTVPKSITVARVRAFPLVSGAAGEFQVGIYRTIDKTVVWKLAGLPAMTANTWLEIIPTAPFTLTAGTYWWAISSNGKVDDTKYFKSPALVYNNTYTGSGDAVVAPSSTRQYLGIGYPVYGLAATVAADGVLPEVLGTISAKNWSATNIWSMFLDSSV
jgi:hypothetical protein